MANSKSGKTAARGALALYIAQKNEPWEPTPTFATDMVTDLLLTFSESVANQIIDDVVRNVSQDRHTAESE